MQRLKSAAKAAGFAMAVSPEHFDEEMQEKQHGQLLALPAPPADRPAYIPHKPPHDQDDQTTARSSTAEWLGEVLGSWRGQRLPA